MPRSVAGTVLFAALALAHAGEFAVAPVRLELGGAARTGVFTIRNEGKQRLTFQVQGMAWTQDAQGRDQYAAASDLVYYPRIVGVDAGTEAVVRVGIRQPLVQVEKTYRLFIEELPAPPAQGASAPGGSVRVLIRFGPPIFVKPVQPEHRLEVERLQVQGGAVHLTLRNAGNEHELVEAIQLRGSGRQGEPGYALALADRYLLAGTAKDYSAPMTRAQCLATARLVLEVKTDKSAVQRQLDLDAAMCR